ncbi:unnamed protein product [Trichobilharzia regenti]|nr:unnamed protein product [Trichobilharzia regenti]
MSDAVKHKVHLMGNCARKHVSASLTDKSISEHNLPNIPDPSKQLKKPCSRSSGQLDSCKSSSIKSLHSNAILPEGKSLTGHENTASRNSRERFTGKDINSGSRSNLSTPKASINNIVPGSHCGESIKEAAITAGFHLQRYSRSGCASATRSAMESPLTVDSGTHKSEKPYRSSVVVDSDRLKHLENNIAGYNGRTVSTTPTTFLGEINSDHRSSTGGLSARYLVHQPFFSSNTGSPSRLSLALGGLVANSKKSLSVTQDNCKTGYYHVAIFDYEAHTAEEVSARKGDQLRVLDFR